MRGVIASLKKMARDETRRRKVVEVGQLYFVALVWVVVFALMFALSGCAEKNKPQANRPTPQPIPPTPQPVPPVVRVPEKETLTVTFLPSSQPDYFTARLDWKSEQRPNRWLIFRRGAPKAGVTELIATVDGDARSALDTNARAGVRYVYLLATGDELQYAVRLSIEITTPRDYWISTPVPMPNLSGIRRLFLRKGAKLKGGASSGDIAVQEIISDGGEFESFSEGEAALPGANGRSAGDITIRARRASGTLKIVVNGESGGVGIDGSPGKPGATGVPGTPGRWDVNPELYNHLNRSFVDSWKREMERNPKPPGNRAWQERVGNWPWYVCALQPTDGGRGGDGSIGADGGAGGNGGDSAKVYVEIAEDSDFKVEVVGQPGGGGLPGRGGLGGPGGSGGPPGPRDRGHLCREAQAGPKGTDGLAGHPGRYGDPGKRRPVCVKIGTKTYGDCR